MWQSMLWFQTVIFSTLVLFGNSFASDDWTPSRFLEEYKKAIPKLRQQFGKMRMVGSIIYPSEDGKFYKRTIKYACDQGSYMLYMKSETSFGDGEAPGYEDVAVVSPDHSFRLLKEPSSSNYKIMGQVPFGASERKVTAHFFLAGAPFGYYSNYAPDFIVNPALNIKSIEPFSKGGEEFLKVQWELRLPRNELEIGYWVFNLAKGWVITECGHRLAGASEDSVVRISYKEKDGVLYPFELIDLSKKLADGKEKVYQHETVTEMSQDVSPKVFELSTYGIKTEPTRPTPILFYALLGSLSLLFLMYAVGRWKRR